MIHNALKYRLAIADIKDNFLRVSFEGDLRKLKYQLLTKFTIEI